ncbi:histidine phosphatase family protein [Propionibacterium sp.]|uniref:histidine phosphatase family protein n=1 Tax=Propionibacterium sp. TaxID=1977903 RepID=UPI0039E99747
MPADVLELALVRHGESTGNLGGRVLGHQMSPQLTIRGRAQASAAAAALIGWGGQELWSSDMMRARQTAEAIASATGLPIRATALLREQNHGRLDGMTASQLVSEPIPEPTEVGADISEVRWGGGESVVDVYRRLREFCGLLSARPPRRIIVVSHGDALCALMALVVGRGHRDVDWEARLRHGEVRWVRWRPGNVLPF